MVVVSILGAAVLLASKAYGNQIDDKTAKALVDLTSPIEDGCSMVFQYSDKPCIYESTWGCDFENNVLWATEGCRGVFLRKTHPHKQIKCGEGLGSDIKYECDLPKFDKKTDVKFFSAAGRCDATLLHPVLKPVDMGVPIPEFGVCFKNKSGHWNVFQCIDDDHIKQTIYSDETCTRRTKYHTKNAETVFENGVCNTNGGAYNMILEWESEPCPVRELQKPVCGFPGFKLKMRVKDRTASFKNVEDSCNCSLMCQDADAWQFNIKRKKCYCRAKPVAEGRNRTSENKNYVSSFPIDE